LRRTETLGIARQSQHEARGESPGAPRSPDAKLCRCPLWVGKKIASVLVPGRFTLARLFPRNAGSLQGGQNFKSTPIIYSTKPSSARVPRQKPYFLNAKFGIAGRQQPYRPPEFLFLLT